MPQNNECILMTVSHAGKAVIIKLQIPQSDIQYRSHLTIYIACSLWLLLQQLSLNNYYGSEEQ
jgi:hypothetical protein